MRSIILKSAICAGLLGAIGACSQAPAPDTGDAVRVVALPYLTHMPFYIAQAEGYFETENLDVEFVTLGRNQEVMTSLAQGDVDVMAGMLTLNELSLAEAGARIRVVAAFASPAPPEAECAQAGILIRREHLESGAAVDPVRLGQLKYDINPYIPLGYALDSLLGRHGLSIDDVETVDLPPVVALEALRGGQVDVTADSEPFVTRHLLGGEAVLWASLNDVLPEFQQSVVLFGPALVDERPEVGKRFMAALLRAMRQFRGGKTPENLAIVEQASGLPADLVAAACWPTLTEDGRANPAAFGGYQEWCVRRGLLDHVLADDELFDHRFIEYANAELAR